MALVTTTEMFKKAYEGHYAIGAFNINNMEIIQAITEAAAEEKFLLTKTGFFQKIAAGDQQNRDYRVILKKGNGWNSYKTADSEKMCLRNPMPLKVASNKATHK